FAQKATAKFLEHLIDPNQNAPELMGGLRIIGGVRVVPFKRGGIRKLAGRRPDANTHAQLAERGHEALVKLRDTLRFQGQGDTEAVAALDGKLMLDEIELY